MKFSYKLMSEGKVSTYMFAVHRYALIIQAVSLLLCFIMIVYFLLRAQKKPILYSYLTFNSLIGIWLIGQILENFALNQEAKWFFVCLEYFAICFMGLVWMIFILYYAEHRFIKKHLFKVLALFIFPITFYGFVITVKRQKAHTELARL